MKTVLLVRTQDAGRSQIAEALFNCRRSRSRATPRALTLVETMAEKVDDDEVHELATWVVGVQRAHVEAVRRASLTLAKEEIRESSAA